MHHRKSGKFEKLFLFVPPICEMELNNSMYCDTVYIFLFLFSGNNTVKVTRYSLRATLEGIFGCVGHLTQTPSHVTNIPSSPFYNVERERPLFMAKE